MSSLIPQLTLFLAQFSRDKRFQTLLRQIAYMKEENRILRSKLPTRITITLAERNRLVRLGKKLMPTIKDLITIMTPRTFVRWIDAVGRRATQILINHVHMGIAPTAGRHGGYHVAELYHSERPHQSKGNLPLSVAATATMTSDLFVSSHSSDVPLRLKDIACRERLGGLLKYYYRKAV